MPGEKFKVFTEIPTNEKMIVNMVTNDQLTLEDACNLLNEQDREIKELRELLDIGETNAKSILDVLNYQQSQINKTIKVLQKHYNYAYDQRQKNLDNAIVAKAYDVLRGTVDEIANELGIEIKK